MVDQCGALGALGDKFSPNLTTKNCSLVAIFRDL